MAGMALAEPPNPCLTLTCPQIRALALAFPFACRTRQQFTAEGGEGDTAHAAFAFFARQWSHCHLPLTWGDRD